MDTPVNMKPGTKNASQNPDGSVTTFFPNGCWSTRTGGSAAWRNNNPGNLKGKGADSLGTDNDGLSIFDGAQAGWDALDTELRDNMHNPGGTLGTLAQSVGRTAEENGWPSGLAQQILDEITAAGGAIDRRYTEVPNGDLKTTILNIIGRANGYEDQGEQGGMECPDGESGSAD